LARTISVDDKTYSELISITAQIMQRAGEQLSLSDTTRLSVALLKSCLIIYPRLEEEIVKLISFDEPNAKYESIKDITPEFFARDFLEKVFGNEKMAGDRGET
jgi:hypothetical protein